MCKQLIVTDSILSYNDKRRIESIKCEKEEAKLFVSIVYSDGSIVNTYVNLSFNTLQEQLEIEKGYYILVV